MTTDPITPLSDDYGVNMSIYGGGLVLYDIRYMTPSIKAVLQPEAMEKLVSFWNEQQPTDRADTTAPDLQGDDLHQAIDLLGRLFFLVRHEGHCDFSNGVTWQGIDEGRVQADRFLDETQEFLAEHGDVYASELRAYRRSLREQIAEVELADKDKLPF